MRTLVYRPDRIGEQKFDRVFLQQQIFGRNVYPLETDKSTLRGQYFNPGHCTSHLPRLRKVKSSRKYHNYYNFYFQREY